MVNISFSIYVCCKISKPIAEQHPQLVITATVTLTCKLIILPGYLNPVIKWDNGCQQGPLNLSENAAWMFSTKNIKQFLCRVLPIALCPQLLGKLYCSALILLLNIFALLKIFMGSFSTTALSHPFREQWSSDPTLTPLWTACALTSLTVHLSFQKGLQVCNRIYVRRGRDQIIIRSCLRFLLAS